MSNFIACFRKFLKTHLSIEHLAPLGKLLVSQNRLVPWAKCHLPLIYSHFYQDLVQDLIC